MNRRSFVAACAVTLSGCSGLSTTRTPTAERQYGGTASGVPFRVDLHAPDTVQIQRDIDITIPITNEGERRVTFSDYLRVGYRDAAPTLHTEQITARPAPGETAYKSLGVAPPYVGTVTIKLQNAGLSEQVETYGPHLSLGQLFETAWSDKVVVRELVTTTQFTHDSDIYSGIVTATPGEAKQFVFIRVECTNTGPQVEHLPAHDTFQLLTDDQQFAPVSNPHLKEYEFTGQFAETELYESARVHPDVTKTGVVIFQVPEEIARKALTVAWSQTTVGRAQQTAYWDVDQ